MPAKWRFALTPGEPAGIGPDICLQLAQQPLPAEIVVVASPDLLYARAKTLDLNLQLLEFHPDKLQASGLGKLTILPVPLAASCYPGELNPANSQYVLTTLHTAYQICIEQQCQALITGPIHKQIISQSGIPFSGHTEYLGKLAGTKVLMCFYTPELIVALATTHCPLHQVSKILTTEKLKSAIKLLHQGLILFNKPNPTIQICGLNPHAGEGGTLGHEEQEIIIPLIKELQKQGLSLSGPWPADTVFAPHQRHQADAILAMYHDQGLAPIKALYFNEIVNITLGLPFLRTSVDHGTALNLAGTGKAKSTSLYKAFTVATKLTATYAHSYSS